MCMCELLRIIVTKTVKTLSSNLWINAFDCICICSYVCNSCSDYSVYCTYVRSYNVPMYVKLVLLICCSHSDYSVSLVRIWSILPYRKLHVYV